MRRIKTFALTAVLFGSLAGLPWTDVRAAQSSPAVAVGPQYDSTHVYVVPDDFDRFVASFIATFGGTTSKEGAFTVTPTPSLTLSQIVMTPVGILSVFGFKTPIPYPFGTERTGYLVTDMAKAVRAARANGADVLVATFPDPIGRDTIIQWPGGVEHAALLAYDRAELRGASDRAREPGLPVADPGRSVHPRFRRLLEWQNRL